MNKFSEMLTLLLKEKNILKKQLALKLNVSVRTIYYWEKGERECDFDTLIKIARFFEITVGQLLGTEEY